MNMAQILEWCLAACDAQSYYFNATRCTNSNEYCCYASASDLIDYFLNKKVEIVSWMGKEARDVLVSVIEADPRFEYYINANDGA